MGGKANTQAFLPYLTGQSIAGIKKLRFKHVSGSITCIDNKP